MTSSSAPEWPGHGAHAAGWIGALWALALLGWALAPLSSMAAGVTWLVLCLLVPVCAWAAWRHPAAPPALSADTGDAAVATHTAVARWTWCTGVACALAGAAMLWWRDPMSSLQDNLRLWLGAAATGWLLRCVAWRWFQPRATMALHATAVACTLAAAVALSAASRDDLPGNAIPWAHLVGFLLCVLVPACVWAPLPRSQRLLWSAAAVLGVAAVVLSQTRSALLVVGWLAALLIAAVHNRRLASWRTLMLTSCAAMALMISTAWWVDDPLRLREGAHDVLLLMHQSSPDSPLGARALMWHSAWQGIVQAPWTGHGIDARIEAVKALAVGRDPVIWGLLTHYHNEYLNAWHEHGVLGLGAVLVTCLGLVLVVQALWRERRVAALQVSGLAVMHISGGITNVNSAHNLYTLALGLAVTIALLGADALAAPRAPHPNHSPHTP